MRFLPRATCALACLFVVALSPERASATLIGQLVGISLGDGGSLALSDAVVVADPGVEITPGDGSAIGGALLPTESIDIRQMSIVLTLEEGAPNGTTGYPVGTTLSFSNLVFSDVPTHIVGFTVSTVNITSLLGITFSNSSLSIPLDALVIGDLPGVDVGSVTIDLQMAFVPEPASAVLVALGLAGLGLARRRARTA